MKNLIFISKTMKPTDELKKDYEKHGYKVKSEKPGLIVFETDREYYKKHVDPEIDKTHPIFTDKHGVQKGDKSTVIMHSKCGYCNEYLVENKCPKCGREYGRFQTAKPHIPYPDEIKQGV